MANSDDNRRSLGFSKRLNIITEPRPLSLINYDDQPPVPSSPNVRDSFFKSTPPVLLRARSTNMSTSNETNSRRASLGPLEDLVQCPICLERLNEPKMLPCQHTFCLNCLQTEYGKEKGNISCPTCKIKHEMGIESYINLPPNMYINALLQVLKTETTAPEYTEIDFQTVHCIKCQTICDDKIEKCRHCKQNFCTICWESHMNELSIQIMKLDDQLSSATEKIHHKLDDFKDRVDHLNTHIHSHVDEQIKILKEKEIILLEKTNNLLKTEIETSNPLIESIVKLRGNIRESVKIRDKVTTFLTLHKQTTEIFQTISQLGELKATLNNDNFSLEVEQEQVPGLNEEFFGDNKLPSIPASPFFKENPFESEASLKRYYNSKIFKLKLHWSKCLRPCGIAVSPWNHEKLEQKLLYICGSDSRLIYGIEMSKGRVIQRISHDEMIFPNCIAFSLEHKEIYVTDKWKHCIFVFSSDGELKRTLCSKGDTESCLRSPEGIFIGKNNTIYVCDTGNDRIQVLNIFDGKMILQFGSIRKDQINRTNSMMANLKNPSAVSVYEDHIIVLDSGNRRVKIFNKLGEKLSEFGQFGSGRGQFKYPDVLAIDKLGFIYVGDGGNTRIQIFQPNGQLVTSFGTRGTTSGKFGWVSGLFVTSDLQIMVTDYKNHSVQIFE